MKKFLITIIAIYISIGSIFAQSDISGKEITNIYNFPVGVLSVEKMKYGKSGTYVLIMINESACYNALYFIPKNKKDAKLLFSSESFCSDISSTHYGRILDFSLKFGKVTVRYGLGSEEYSLKTYSKDVVIN